ncbi:hypothetical protein NQT62_03645 [Limnobacter humi]|uniref:Uncharacterized protein n=1 Tax=Limnobacter humi TaxID=1778671 RepID=A0ABT1WDD2_9BURK|nr:hypothetical protein [Limnobacter humi]MCQ8895534.1 hypothetical protein [Limnobacter humi]
MGSSTVEAIFGLAQAGLQANKHSIEGWDEETVSKLLAQFDNNPQALLAFLLANGGAGSSNDILASLTAWLQKRSWSSTDSSLVAQIGQLLVLLAQATSGNLNLSNQLNNLRPLVAVLSAMFSVLRGGGINASQLNSMISALGQTPPNIQALRELLTNPGSTGYVASTADRDAMIALLNVIHAQYPTALSDSDHSRLVQFVRFNYELSSLVRNGSISQLDKINLLATFSATDGLNVAEFTARLALIANRPGSFPSSIQALASMVYSLQGQGVLQPAEATEIGKVLYNATLSGFIAAYGTSSEQAWLANGIPGMEMGAQERLETVAALITKRTGRELPSVTGSLAGLNVTGLNPSGRLDAFERALVGTLNANLNELHSSPQVDSFKIYFTYFFDVDDPTKTGDADPSNDLMVVPSNAYSALVLMQNLLNQSDLYVPATLLIRVLGNYAATVINEPGLPNKIARDRLSTYRSATNRQSEIDMFAISLALTNNSSNPLVIGLGLVEFNTVFDGIDSNAAENLNQLSELGNANLYYNEFWARQLSSFSRMNQQIAVLVSEQTLLRNESTQRGTTEERKSEISSRLSEIDQRIKDLNQNLSELYQVLMAFLNKKDAAVNKALASA